MYNNSIVMRKGTEMQKVEMVVAGRRALVDADMVKKMTKKQELVAEAMSLQKYYEADKVAHAYALPMLQKKAGQIIRLNRTIRQTVQFI
jgi:2,4-dienoyl-CoA reductase-like NADH-dependent reductase (Old Yellow Enzyme family)